MKKLIPLLLLSPFTEVSADPCGMVPPITVASAETAVVRSGAQRTYMFFKDGMETIALRPGFEGNIDNFGMLIPFPNPPAIRKIEDDTFAHIEAAIDPPKVKVHIYEDYPDEEMEDGGAMPPPSPRKKTEKGLQYNEIRVLKEEAVGMYQVAVLQAGSSGALKKWMDKNGYKYPTGMDEVTNEYVAIQWCFVAVKATVGQAPGVEPKPGMRDVNPKLPDGASFDGYVQGMAFRFPTDEPVIPMRLSVFNGKDPRNIVYALTEKPVKINNISEDLVLRQVNGDNLHHNVTKPLQVEYLNGTKSEVKNKYDLDRIKKQRDQTKFNSIARDLFASDLLALRQQSLSLPHEETEKDLLRVSESFGLRGPEVDKLHLQESKTAREVAVQGALDDLNEMSISVIDGTFSGEVLARENLSFSSFTMPKEDNTRRNDSIRPNDISLTVYR